MCDLCLTDTIFYFLFGMERNIVNRLFALLCGFD